jgi:O-methyltransferase involved in polyketide biosynthesis
MTTTRLALEGIPETMLWTLHNRANEARKPNGYLKDPDCVRIYDAIDYDYTRNFGTPDGSHPMRSRLFDDKLRPWLQRHPGGAVVELAAGLETQFQRCDDGRVRWYCVDVPEAIAVREQFLPASERCKHIAKSALDLSWLDDIDGTRGVFVSAQGLLMYFQEAQVRELFCAIVDRFPGAVLMFDAIPSWFSKRTLQGFGKTKHYTAPPMPWGIGRDDLEPLLRSWSPRVSRVSSVPYGYARNGAIMLMRLFSKLPVLRNQAPMIAYVETRS